MNVGDKQNKQINNKKKKKKKRAAVENKSCIQRAESERMTSERGNGEWVPPGRKRQKARRSDREKKIYSHIERR
jgi:hypothetical protein